MAEIDYLLIAQDYKQLDCLSNDPEECVGVYGKYYYHTYKAKQIKYTIIVRKLQWNSIISPITYEAEVFFKLENGNPVTISTMINKKNTLFDVELMCEQFYHSAKVTLYDSFAKEFGRMID